MNELICNIIFGSIYTSTFYYLFIYNRPHNPPDKQDHQDHQDQSNQAQPNQSIQSLTFDKHTLCVLCLSDFTKHTSIIIPDCNHLLHLDCYTKLVKSKCPTHKQCPTCRELFIKASSDENIIQPSPTPNPNPIERVRRRLLPPSPSRIQLPNHYPHPTPRPTRPPHPTPHPTPHPSPSPVQTPQHIPRSYPTPRPVTNRPATPRTLRRSHRLATIYPDQEEDMEILPSPNALRHWNQYNHSQQDSIIRQLFYNTNLENLLYIKHQNDNTIIANEYKLRIWNLHTRQEKEIMIRQIFPD